jgi:hypothetical protein
LTAPAGWERRLVRGLMPEAHRRSTHERLEGLIAQM